MASVTRVASDFLRLRLEAPSLERLARDMIHFRIVLPRMGGRETVWPCLCETGQTVWPDELHRPAYTVRGIEAAAGWLETDIYIHEGGRTCTFTASAVRSA